MDFHRIKNILLKHTLNDSEWKGAVLFLCNEEHVFLIKRSEDMPTHGGQIAFVGGHKILGELDPWIVAQREFEEETHFSGDCVEYLGCLPMVMTARLQPIIPVVAKLTMSTSQFLTEVKSNGEWDDILAYPWSELTQEKNWEYAWRHGFNSQSAVMFHPIKAGSYLHLENNTKPHLLWGATANMIWTFLRLYFNR
jgi:8-oxo-dGTP pyrophosphatase MutT (NUDIX family)